MKALYLLAAALLPALAAAQPGAVDVRFSDLQKFTDFTVTHGGAEREAQGLADDLRVHLERRAPAFIPQGTRLEVAVRDVDMAGEFLPSRHSPHSMLRIVRGVYMPRVDLDFRLLGSGGRVLAEAAASCAILPSSPPCAPAATRRSRSRRRCSTSGSRASFRASAAPPRGRPGRG